MKFWVAISRGPVNRAVSSFSIFILAAAASASFSALSAALAACRTPHEVFSRVLSDRAAASDPDISNQLARLRTTGGAADRETLARHVRSMVALRAMAEHSSGAGAEQSARQIKSSSLYRDAGLDEESNWLGRALDRLKNIRLDPQSPQVNWPNLKGVGRWLVPILWTLLGLGALVLAYVGLMHVDWTRKLARKPKTVLEDDEPDQTVDEWLASADRLTEDGRYREAVRALYLACLLRFDEYRVARFDRHETNWEHLRRIHRSPKRPAGLDFTPATRAFDRIWYGQVIDGRADVDQFRQWYSEYLGILRGAGA